MEDLRSPDPFLVSWGEAGAWRGAHYQAQLLASLPPALVEWEPGTIFKMTRALGQAHALRNYLVKEVDDLVPSLRSPHLHRAMAALRSSRRGPRRWRRYWVNRAASMADLVDAEHVLLSQSRLQLDAWVRALDQGIVGVVQQQTWVGANTPGSELQRDWSNLFSRLREGEEGLKHLRESFIRLIEGTECLRLKAEMFADVCNAVPSHEDVLSSVSLTALTAKLIEVPPSGVPEARE